MANLLDKAPFSHWQSIWKYLYDAEKCYEAIWKHKGKAIIPIKKNIVYAKLSKPSLKPRNDQLLVVSRKLCL